MYTVGCPFDLQLVNTCWAFTMIVRSGAGREHHSWFDRIKEWFWTGDSIRLDILPPQKFELEIAKESARSNRRPFAPDFALISLGVKPQEDLIEFISEVKKQLRISDCVGAFKGQVCLLCPETDLEGAKVVANQVIQIGLKFETPLDTQIFIYPWDDELVRPSDDDHEEVSQHSKSDESPKEEIEAVSSLARATSFSSQLVPVVFLGEEQTPWWKRCTDISLAGLLLCLATPIFLAAAAAIKLTSRGPVFFKQEREGKDGQRFFIWKFRTMVVDAEAQKDGLRAVSEQDGPAFKLADDPRVTSVGRYLRKSCIDELPQLINVLLGHMSMVGPRPLPVDESLACEGWHRSRLRVLPGLTCIWQVDGGRETRFSDWMRMDLRYIRQRSFLLDLKIITKTAFVALLHRGSV